MLFKSGGNVPHTLNSLVDNGDVLSVVFDTKGQP